MKTETVQKVIAVITWTEKRETLKAVSRFLSRYEARIESAGRIDRDVSVLRSMIQDKRLERAW